jgi:hypothetical protein
MGTFVNDSGVIIASHNNEVIRFEKDGLQIFTDNKNVVLVSIQQNQRIERRYLASEISAPSNSGADDLKRKLFLMLEDYGAGGGGGVTDLQGAYDGGNVVNGATVIIEGTSELNFGVGTNVLQGNTGGGVVALGFESGKNNEGNQVVALGIQSGLNNSGDHVNAFGYQAGIDNDSDNCNFFGYQAGTNNSTSFGVTVFSPESIPSYANKGAADAALTVANGCVAGQIYIFRNEANDNIGFIIPSA